MNNFDLKDKIAVVTGGAQGFGYAIAKRFASSSAKVIILDNDPEAISTAINKNEIKFIITDYKNEIIVSYKGAVPALFAEGKGVVAEGILQDKKFFLAKRILAKHDENYMPPKIKESLEKNAK